MRPFFYPLLNIPSLRYLTGIPQPTDVLCLCRIQVIVGRPAPEIEVACHGPKYPVWSGRPLFYRQVLRYLIADFHSRFHRVESGIHK